MVAHWKDASVEENAAEARRRIREVAQTGARLLNLGDLLLAELPAELSELDALEGLALGDDLVAESGGEFSFQREPGEQPHAWKKDLVLPNLAPLSGLKNLRRLSLRWVHVKDISALASLPALEWLDMGLCTAVDIAPLAVLSRLKYLDLANDGKLNLAPLAHLTALEHLNLEGRPVKDLSALSKLPNLQHLSVRTFAQADVASLKDLPRLKTLKLERCRFKDLAQFQGGFKSLRELDLYGASVADLTGISGLANLRTLKLAGPKKLADLSPLASLANLELLDLTMCKHVRDLAPLADLPHLHTLILDETGVKDFAPLERMKALKALDVSDLPLRSLAPFANLQNLQVLNLHGCHKIEDISLLANMTDLRELDLSELALDLSPLARLPRLEKLKLFAARVNDLSPLRGLKRLRVLSLWSCRAEAGAASLGELTGLRDLNLFGFSTGDPCPFERLLPLLDHLEVLRVGKSAFPEVDKLGTFGLNDLAAVKAHYASRAPAAKTASLADEPAGQSPGASVPPAGGAPRRRLVMPAGIREKLDWLSRSDPELWPFGGSGHGYRLAPPLSEAELRHACEAYAISLPEDFRRFLLEVGSGGAGPAYGLERFGFVPSRALIPQGRPRQGIAEAVGDLLDDQGRKVEPFDVSFYGTIGNLAGDGVYGPRAPARPFPLTAPLEGEDEEEEQSGLFDTFQPADGVWTLASYGCGMLANLVLNGPFFGQVWFYDPNVGSYQPFAARAYLHSEECPLVRERADPAVFTFSEWYEHWLDYAYLQVWEDRQGGN